MFCDQQCCVLAWQGQCLRQLVDDGKRVIQEQHPALSVTRQDQGTDG